MSLQRIYWRRSLWQLPASCRRTISQAAARANDVEETRSQRGQFRVPELFGKSEEYDHVLEHGLYDQKEAKNPFKRLFSAVGFKTAYPIYQEDIIRKLNQRIAERGFEGQLKDLIIRTARDPAEASVFNYASMAHNNHYFFQGLATAPDQPMGDVLRRAIINDFGSVENLKAEMLTMAEAMFGPGFVWLVRVDSSGGLPGASKREFKLLPTYLAGSPYAGAHNRRQPVDMTTQNVANAKAAGGVEALSRKISEQHTVVQNKVGSFGDLSGGKSLAYGGVDVNPCLCVSTWEHTYLYDWKFNKRHFLDRWWTFINWREVAVRAGLQDETGEGRTRSQYQTPYGTRAQRQ